MAFGLGLVWLITLLDGVGLTVVVSVDAQRTRIWTYFEESDMSDMALLWLSMVLGFGLMRLRVVLGFELVWLGVVLGFKLVWLGVVLGFGLV